MLTVHVAFEMRVCCVAAPLVVDRLISEVVSDGYWLCDDVVFRSSDKVAFGRTEETSGPVEAASVGRRISCSLEIPVPRLLMLRDEVAGETAASVEADTDDFVVRVTLEYGA